jgi:hypothetical protein
MASLELIRIVGFTRKKLSHRSNLSDPPEQRAWWVTPPFGNGFGGCFGVPTDWLVDLDESGFHLATCN